MVISSINWDVPLVNVYITMENYHFHWVNPLFLWPFSIAMPAMLVYQRVSPIRMVVVYKVSRTMTGTVPKHGYVQTSLILPCLGQQYRNHKEKLRYSQDMSDPYITY